MDWVAKLLKEISPYYCIQYHIMAFSKSFNSSSSVIPSSIFINGGSASGGGGSGSEGRIKPNINFTPSSNCFVVSFGEEIQYLISSDKINMIMSTIFWNMPDDTCIWPYYIHNGKPVSLFQKLFMVRYTMNDDLNVVFKDGNKGNLKTDNIEIYHPYHTTVCKTHDVIEYFQGHIPTNGPDAYLIKNPIWKIRVDTSGSEEFIYCMYCEPNALVFLDDDAISRITEFNKTVKYTACWYRMNNSYVAGTFIINGSRKILYMHQVIMNHFGNGKGTSSGSVDHIDRDVLNNRLSNLRIVTTEVQQSNQKHVIEKVKKSRQKTARPLPDGITQDMLPKYVNYYIEHYGKDKACSREFFRIESHPMLEKDWATTKSGKVSLLTKLQQAKDKLAELDTALSCVVSGESETEPETESAMTTTVTSTSTPQLTGIIEGVNTVIMLSTASSTPI